MHWAVLLVIASGCDPPPETADHTIEVIGTGTSLCADGTVCPGSGLGCPNGDYCIQRKAAATSVPAGLACSGQDTSAPCIGAFPGGTEVHVSINGGGAGNCYFVTCTTQPAGTNQGCEADLVMTQDYVITLGCYSP